MNKPRFVMFYLTGKILRENDSILNLFDRGTVPSSLVGDRTTGLVLSNDGEWIQNPWDVDMP
jgi:hypothetical protein